MSNTYTVTVINDFSGHQVSYSGWGDTATMKIVSEVVRRHIRDDDGSCIRTDPLMTVTTDEETLMSWPEFIALEARLRSHLQARVMEMLSAQPQEQAQQNTVEEPE